MILFFDYEYIRTKDVKISIVGIVYGKFDILHAGHIRLFRFAKSRCDKLIVAVLENSEAGKLRDVDLRVKDISAINLIDQTIVYNDVHDLLRTKKPDVIFKGNEFRQKINDEEATINFIGANLIFMSSDERYNVQVKELNYVESGKNYLSFYRKKYQIKDDEIRKSINSFQELKGIITGELIYDQYVNCSPKGMSQEDKNIVYEKGDLIEYIGGAGIVAGHCNSLGSHAELVSVVGKDEMGRKSSKSLQRINTKSKLWLDETRNTIVKTRFIWDEKPIFRLSVLDSVKLVDSLQQDFLVYIDNKLKEVDYLIISDFNYGLLSEDVCKCILESAKKNNIPVSVDCQISSQTGDLKKYSGLKLVTATELEARSALRDFDSGVAYLGEKLKDQLEAEHLILKLGAEGALILTEIDGKNRIEKLPALQVERVIDTSGAGDSMLAAATLMLCATNNIYMAAYLGSLAAGIQVTRRGNSPLLKNFWLEI